MTYAGICAPCILSECFLQEADETPIPLCKFPYTYTSFKQVQVVYAQLCRAVVRVPVAHLICRNLLNILLHTQLKRVNTFIKLNLLLNYYFCMFVGNHVSIIHGSTVTLHLKWGLRDSHLMPALMPILLPCLPTCLDVEPS